MKPANLARLATLFLLPLICEAHAQETPDPQEKGFVGQWYLDSSISPLDDSTRAFLILASEAPISDPYGRDASISLTVACRENTTAAWINFGNHFMSSLNGGGKVTYRVDEQPAASISMVASNDHEVLGLWSGAKSIPWLKEIMGGTKLYVEATPFSESTVGGYLPIANMDQAIGFLRQTCSW